MVVPPIGSRSCEKGVRHCGLGAADTLPREFSMRKPYFVVRSSYFYFSFQYVIWLYVPSEGHITTHRYFFVQECKKPLNLPIVQKPRRDTSKTTFHFYIFCFAFFYFYIFWFYIFWFYIFWFYIFL